MGGAGRGGAGEGSRNNVKEKQRQDTKKFNEEIKKNFFFKFFRWVFDFELMDSFIFK